jgi:hypothetical protein
MSLALLAQVYEETRRLAIAGSVVAPNDFRMKKLIAPLEQVGAKAAVFAKVAEGIKAVVESTDQTSAEALLDLATLVNAILYTQGETGIAGELAAIETTDLGLQVTQTSARVLKPLLEALATKGSGRLELIRDAYEHGAFRDLRLIQPALAAVDDVYPEITDLICDKVLPLYGTAILPALRSSFDMKGRAGHARRLRLIHQLDPAGSRALVKQALEEGSKEVKVAAIECLGQDRDDISYLIEQASARAQEVRQAAYGALAHFDDDAVIAVLQKAFAGKDLAVAADALRRSRSEKLLGFMHACIEEELAELPGLEEKKDISTGVGWLTQGLECLRGRVDVASEALLLKMFGARANLAKIKGATLSGADLNSTVVRLLAEGTARMAATLVGSHAELDARDLAVCFAAARRCLPAEQVYTTFSPYLAATDKKKGAAADKRAAIASQLGHTHALGRVAEAGPFDPRWLDAAVASGDIHLVAILIRPGHEGANRFLSRAFAEQIKSAKQVHECEGVVAAMARAQHPEATDAAIALIEKFNDKTGYFGYYLGHFIVDLPKSSLPRLEALIPKLNDRVADVLLAYMQQLRDKP